MRLLVLIIAGVLVACGSASARSAPVLVWSDEFNGTQLDTTKWLAGWDSLTGITNPVNQQLEQACYDPANVVIGGGVATITAEQRPCTTVYGTTYPYATGHLSTWPYRVFGWGIFEARMYVPPAVAGGIADWPIFWTLGANWPTGGEIDIAEGGGGVLASNYHSSSSNARSVPAGIWSGWHTFRAEWRHNLVIVSWDGRQVMRVTRGVSESSAHSLNVGLMVPPNSWGYVAPAVLLVDYVRVWK